MTTNPALRSNSPSPLTAAIAKHGKNLMAPVVFTAAILLVWQLLCMSESSLIPGPIRMVSDTMNYILDPFFDNGGTDKGLGWQILISLQRVALGYSIAAVIGIVAGVILGSNEFIRRGADPVIQVLRTVPPLAWLPIALGVFQNSDPAAIFVIFITAVWPIVINTAMGVQQIPQDYKNVAKVLRLSPQEYIFNVLVPATVPYVFTGLRIGVGLAWLAIVAAEMLKANGGIGFFIWDAYNSSGSDGNSQIILAIIYMGLVGLLLDKLVGWIGHLIAPGEPQ
jgi:nitrate/nitrite transport system permease protein